MTRALSVHGNVSFFGLDYEKYDGSIVNTFLAQEYRPWGNLEFCAGHALFDLEIGKDRRTDEYDADFEGPIMYAKVAFSWAA